VGVHADDDLSPGFADRPIQPRGGDSFGIVQDPDVRKFPFEFVEDLPRPIVAHAVGDQNFHFDPAKFLAKNGIQKRADVPNFIPARDYH
jgi:hypothetical protein